MLARAGKCSNRKTVEITIRKNVLAHFAFNFKRLYCGRMKTSQAELHKHNVDEN